MRPRANTAVEIYCFEIWWITMPFSPAQAAAAEQAQWRAARDPAPRIRLVAGPGTGKSATIEKRVAHLLNNGSAANQFYVISFTRAACAELQSRISRFCETQPCAAIASQIRVSTMHSLALRILRSAAVLATLYPDDRMVLDDWEQENLYDIELANSIGCTPGRAAEIRLAHDAQWQTLNPQSIAQAAITNAERHGFDIYHTTRRNLYSCVLPGEMVYECVQRLQLGAIQADQLPPIDHLIVDEFQDLNACDQEFVRRLVANGAILFVAGDDDQSVYSFRHANPDGIINFEVSYPNSVIHNLTACFRCTPAILQPATDLISHNPGRLPKQLVSLYSTANPPVQGATHVWSFPDSQTEARAIAQSCMQLIQSGMSGQEDDIVILIFNRRLQVANIARELGNLGLPFDPPAGEALKDETAFRAVYTLLRLVSDLTTNSRDYIAYRSLLGQLHGVGATTAKSVGDQCINNHQNYRALFQLVPQPHWLTGRAAAAVTRVQNALQQINGWTLQDTLAVRANAIGQILTGSIFIGSAQSAAHLDEWNALSASLPQEMTLGELLTFFGTDEVGQRSVLGEIAERLGQNPNVGQVAQKRIRILTMHGAKGLSVKIVFIPSAEQGLMPSFRAIQAVGLLIEQRRLFYVSLTRAKACCIVSHSALHSGAEAFLIRQQPRVRLPRSQFLNEMRVASTNRNAGLSQPEALAIVAHVNNL
jgi:DNA helicase II / ATP-dependent DNA helicase PcrA